MWDGSLVGGVPLVGSLEVLAAVTLESPHRVHRVLERLAVGTEVSPAPLPVLVDVGDEERGL